MAWNKDLPIAGRKARYIDDDIRDINNPALEAAIDDEHDFTTGGTQTGQHTQGSARCFFQDAAPSTRVDGTAFTSTDFGSLWIDSNSSPDNQFNVLTAIGPVTWTPVSTEIIATLLAAARVFASTLGVTGDFAVNTDKFTITAASGNTLIAGTLDVTGIATLGDTSKLATSGAPAADAQIANKKYVDDTPHTGGIVQVVNYQTGAVATGTTLIPYDDTIPQNTEGDQYLSLAITPKSATNKLLIEVVLNLNHSSASAGGLWATLFQDAAANALAICWGGKDSAANRSTEVVLRHYMTAGTTSATTFKVRAGASVAGTTILNGDQDETRRFGGVMASSITITEIKV